MKQNDSAVPERQNPPSLRSTGSEGIAGSSGYPTCSFSDTPDRPVNSRHKLTNFVTSCKFLLSGPVGEFCASDRNSKTDACHGFNLDYQINPALTAPIVNRPVKLPRADLTRQTDLVLSNQRECLVPACLQRAARDSGVGLEPSQGKRATVG